MAYATTIQLAQALGMAVPIPSAEPGVALYETVGTGDDSETAFSLDHGRVIASSYTLYYGASITSPTALTETTHYTLDKDTGVITLTGAGVTLVSTNNIYARYQYINADYGFTDSYLATVIARADKRVDGKINSTFTDGTATNPSWPAVTLETQQSKGWSDRMYPLNEKPVVDIAGVLDGDHAIDAVTVDLVDASEFPSSGRILIGNEIITYTGITTNQLTGCTRGVDGSTAAIHLDTVEVHTTCVQVSGTSEGTTPSWYTLAWGSEFFINETSGFVQVYRTGVSGEDYISSNLHHHQDVQNRFRASYLYGYKTIPEDITRLSIIIAKQMLVKDNVSRAFIAGRNEFNPSLSAVGNAEIDDIVNEYIVLDMGNT